MPTIIPVRFAYASRDLWFDPVETGAVEGDHVICSTERGTEIGLATGEPREVSDEEFAAMTDGATLKPVVRVADDGPGISADDLPHVFERFYKGAGGKHGIGLAIAQAVAESCHGTLTAHNNGGAVFELKFPPAESE